MTDQNVASGFLKACREMNLSRQEVVNLLKKASYLSPEMVREIEKSAAWSDWGRGALEWGGALAGGIGGGVLGSMTATPGFGTVAGGAAGGLAGGAAGSWLGNRIFGERKPEPTTQPKPAPYRVTSGSPDYPDYQAPVGQGGASNRYMPSTTLPPGGLSQYGGIPGEPYGSSHLPTLQGPYPSGMLPKQSSFMKAAISAWRSRKRLPSGRSRFRAVEQKLSDPKYTLPGNEPIVPVQYQAQNQMTPAGHLPPNLSGMLTPSDVNKFHGAPSLDQVIPPFPPSGSQRGLPGLLPSERGQYLVSGPRRELKMHMERMMQSPAANDELFLKTLMRQGTDPTAVNPLLQMKLQMPQLAGNTRQRIAEMRAKQIDLQAKRLTDVQANRARLFDGIKMSSFQKDAILAALGSKVLMPAVRHIGYGLGSALKGVGQAIGWKGGTQTGNRMMAPQMVVNRNVKTLQSLQSQHEQQLIQQGFTPASARQMATNSAKGVNTAGTRTKDLRQQHAANQQTNEKALQSAGWDGRPTTTSQAYNTMSEGAKNSAPAGGFFSTGMGQMVGTIGLMSAIPYVLPTPGGDFTPPPPQPQPQGGMEHYASVRNPFSKDAGRGLRPQSGYVSSKVKSNRDKPRTPTDALNARNKKRVRRQPAGGSATVPIPAQPPTIPGSPMSQPLSIPAPTTAVAPPVAAPVTPVTAPAAAATPAPVTPVATPAAVEDVADNTLRNRLLLGLGVGGGLGLGAGYMTSGRSKPKPTNPFVE